ncbi:MAG TPA: polyprenyl synthetase family protein [Ktedonobacteraceae bacterium]
MVEAIDLALTRCLLRARLCKYLRGLEPALREDVSAALGSKGKLLHTPSLELDGRWALAPFCLAYDLSAGRAGVGIDALCDVSLALECVISATDLLDDVMDDDMTPLIERLGIGRVLNAALALISLSQRLLIALLDQDLPVLLSVRLMDMVQNAIMQASTGQQQDLLAERRPACDLTREECLEIAAAKAGALLSLACQMGALCAGLEEAGVARCVEVGRLLGIAAQLDNDAHDLAGLLQTRTANQRRAEGSQKSDLARGKKTLPVVLAAHALQTSNTRDAREIDFRHLDLLLEGERASYSAALREGILTTWGLALLYRERAGELLRELLGERPVSLELCRVLGLDDVLVEKEVRILPGDEF